MISSNSGRRAPSPSPPAGWASRDRRRRGHHAGRGGQQQAEPLLGLRGRLHVGGGAGVIRRPSIRPRLAPYGDAVGAPENPMMGVGIKPGEDRRHGWRRSGLPSRLLTTRLRALTFQGSRREPKGASAGSRNFTRMPLLRRLFASLVCISDRPRSGCGVGLRQQTATASGG